MANKLVEDFATIRAGNGDVNGEAGEVEGV